MRQQIRNANTKTQSLLFFSLTKTQALVIFLIVSTVFVFPLIVANVDYVDDLARRSSGYYDWGGLGRFFAEALMKIVTFSNNGMADVGHFMQILSIFVLAISGYVVARTLSRTEKTKVLHVLVSLVVVCNPLLLANLSFKFDSFSMILAYALAIVAACLSVRSKSLKVLIMVILLLFVSAGLYQAMVLVFLPVAVALHVHKYLSDKDVNLLPGLLLSLGGFIGGIILYYIVLKLGNFAYIGGSSRGAMLPLSVEGLKGVEKNYYHAWEVIVSFISPIAIKIIVLGAAISAIASLIIITIKRFMSQRRIVNFLVIAVTVAMLPFLVLGPFALLDSGLIYQVRTLSNAIGILFLIFVILSFATSHYAPKLVGVFAAIVVLWLTYALGFSYTYASTLSAQREYDKVVYDEIDDYLLNEESVKNAPLVFIGGTPSSPSTVSNAIKKRPALAYMDIAGNNSLWYMWTSLSDANVTSSQWYVYSTEQQADRRKTCDAEPKSLVSQKRYFSAHKNDTGVVTIWLKNPIGKDLYCEE